MRGGDRVRPEFVDSIPDQLEEGVVYVSLRNKTMLHSCCCGCGEEVETPLSPAEWSFSYDGEDISLSPSIGNTGLECKAHYWIKRCRLEWSNRMSDKHIDAVRARDSRDFHKSIGAGQDSSAEREPDSIQMPEATKAKSGIWNWIKRLFSR